MCSQGDISCGPSSHPDFIKNYFLSNSPFPPIPDARMQQLKAPCFKICFTISKSRKNKGYWPIPALCLFPCSPTVICPLWRPFQTYSWQWRRGWQWCYIDLTLMLHCYTTLLLHCFYIATTLLHCYYIATTLLLYCYYLDSPRSWSNWKDPT